MISEVPRDNFNGLSEILFGSLAKLSLPCDFLTHRLMSPLITLLAKLMPKDLLIVHLQEAIDAFVELPIDDNFTKLSMCCTLVALKSDADSQVIHELLESMAKDRIPFFTASAN